MNPKCAIVSDFNQLSLSLVKRLATNNLNLFVLTSDIKRWKQNLLNSGVDNVEIGRLRKIDGLSYAIFIDLTGKKISLKKFKDCKTILITRSLLPKDEDFSKTIYIGELLEEDFDTNQSLVLELIAKAKRNKKLIIQNCDQDIYVSNIKKILDPLVREVFTFSGDEVLVGARTSLFRICKTLKDEMKIDVLRDPSKKPLEPRNIKRIVNIDVDITKEIKNLLPEVKTKEEPKKTKKNKRKPVTRSKLKSLFLSAMAAFALLVFPYFVLLLSGIGLLSVGNFSLKGKLSYAKSLNKVTNITSSVSKDIFLRYVKLPLIGHVYEDGYLASDLINKVSDIGTNGFLAVDYASEMSKKVLGASDTDLETLSNQLYLVIDDVYKKSSFLVNDFNKYTKLFSGAISQEKIDEGRNYLYNAREITSNLPILLGVNEPKTYMVLFQNNMELRPTGGFIGSFALITVNDGQILNSQVYDVYTADGQLKGYVKPPDAIRDYLGEPAWYLRDSNWDPDFTVSSKRAEWFLDKSLDQKVDGVIGINLEVIRSLIEVTGPIELSDFDDTLDANNFYQKIQDEVENNFFPGSRKKANYLTALSNAAITRLSNISPEDSITFFRSMLARLNSRDIQIYTHNQTVGEALENLHWSGSVNPPNCNIDNCAGVLVGLTEANVGVNKANINISRDAQLYVEIYGDYIDYKLAVNITNNAPATSDVGKYEYKNYMRVLTNKKAEFKPIQVFSGDEVYSISPEIKDLENHKEAGVYLNTVPGAESRVVYNWRTENKLDFDHSGSMNFLIRKQSGVKDMPFELSIENKDNLTLTGPFRYNTTLSTDYNHNFSW